MRNYEITKEAIEYALGEQRKRFIYPDKVKTICEMRLSGKSYIDIADAVMLSPSRCREYVEKVCRIYACYSRDKAKDNTWYNRIKAMSVDEMASFFTYLESRGIITTADRYICRQCKSEHGRHCPIGDDEKCLYDLSTKDTIKMWLNGGADDYAEGQKG